MLTAKQIDALQNQSEKLLDPITDFLIEDISKRVAEAGQFTATASYDAWQLQKLGVSQRQLKKEIAKRLGVSVKEAEKLLTQAAETGYNFDMSRFPTTHAIPLSANSSLQQILDATVKLAGEDLTNMTQTMGFVGPDGVCRELTDAYVQACDFAFQKVSTGAQDYVSAIRDATRNLAEKGIRTIDFKSGYHTSIEAAVRKNIMSGLGLMQEQISQQNHDDLGCDGWEISAHAGSAPDHEPIQGKQYSDKVYRRLNNSLVRRIGTLNCGHAAFPIIMSVNEPQYTEAELEDFRRSNEEGVTFDGKHYTIYEATQRQRKFERTIRKQKRRILVDEATGDTDKLQTDQVKLVRLRQEYARFSKKTGLPMQHARMETAGFDWKKAKATEKVAREQNSSMVASVSKNSFSSMKGSGMKDASWRQDVGTEKWQSDKRRELFKVERNIVNRKTEKSVIYDSNGEAIFTKNGNKGEVHFTQEETRKMRGGILTHNHPNSSCFSPEDIHTLFNAKLSEIRAVTEDGVYRLQRPKEWPKTKYSLENIEQIYYDIDKEVCIPIFDKARAGKISFAEAERTGQIEVIKELGKRYGLAFEFETWEMLGGD